MNFYVAFQIIGKYLLFINCELMTQGQVRVMN